MVIVKKSPAIDDRSAVPTPPARTPYSTASSDPKAPVPAPLIALLALASVFYLTGLGTLDLWAPDEPRYGAIAEELRSGRHGLRGLVLLHLNGEPYDQKPPLYFWLAAAFGLPFGRVGEIAARLPSAVSAIASVGLTFAIARQLRFPTPAALLSAGLLATSFRFAFTARRAQLDVLLTAFELAAIAFFLVLETRRGGLEQARRHPGLLAALHGALGLAALVKGPVGWLPLPVFAVWLAWEGRLPAFRKLVPAWSWLLSLGPVALWIAGAIALAPEGFAEGAVGTNVFGRFFAGTAHVRPFYYYAYQLPLDFLPWSPLWLAALPALARACRAPDSRAAGARFLAVWCLIPLTFFTLSAGKRGLYLLPIFPALALICNLARPGRPQSRAMDQPGPPNASGHASTRSFNANPARALAGVVAVVATIELGAALLVLPRFDGEKSPRPIALAIARRSDPEQRVGLYRLRPLEGAVPYYGGRAVTSLASEAGAERFLADESRLILLRSDDFARLEARLALEPLERFRSGRRGLVLAQSRPSPPGSPPPATAPPGSGAPPQSPTAGSPPPFDPSDAAH